MNGKHDSKKSWWEILATLTPLILGIFVTGVGAFFTQVYNYRQLQLNQLATLDKFKQQLLSENDFERAFAYATFNALGYKDLALELIRLKKDSAGRAFVQDIELTGTSSAKAEAKAMLSDIPVRVYLQIADNNQKQKAEAIRMELAKNGYVAPEVENVKGKAYAPKITSVRFFNQQDETIANNIANLLKSKGLKSATATSVKSYSVKPGSLEIWFAQDDL